MDVASPNIPGEAQTKCYSRPAPHSGLFTAMSSGPSHAKVDLQQANGRRCEMANKTLAHTNPAQLIMPGLQITRANQQMAYFR